MKNIKLQIFGSKIIALILCFAFVLIPTNVFALTKAQLQAQSDYYAAQAKAAAAAAAQKQKEADDAKRQMNTISADINSTQQDLNSTKDAMSSTQDKIDELSEKIKTEEDNLTREKAKMNNILASWYMEGEDGLLEAMIGANNLSEIVDKQEYYDSIKQQIQTGMDKIDALKKELDAQKNQQNEQLQGLSILEADQEEQKKTLQNQQVMKQRLLTDTTNAVKELNAQEQEALKKEKEAQGEIQRMEQIAQGGSNWVRSGSSAFGFMWPVPGASKGCGFGFSSCYFTGVFHTGIDLKRYLGAPVVASKAGRVIVVKDGIGNTYPSSKSYGNYVQIEHEGGVTTLYGHLKSGSLRVRVGDNVQQGQEIGAMGNTGFSTGTHTHFEMRDPYGVAVDPAPSLP
ncbi:MAG: peptidoglycan DD-metalloendopeptidase family protein [Patescibacteria group bacterium]